MEADLKLDVAKAFVIGVSRGQSPELIQPLVRVGLRPAVRRPAAAYSRSNVTCIYPLQLWTWIERSCSSTCITLLYLYMYRRILSEFENHVLVLQLRAITALTGIHVFF